MYEENSADEALLRKPQRSWNDGNEPGAGLLTTGTPNAGESAEDLIIVARVARGGDGRRRGQ